MKISLIKQIYLALAVCTCVYLLAMSTLAVSGLRDKIAKADVALVLGNTVMPDGTPSPRLRARLDKTLALYQAGYFPTIIVSGGMGKEGFDEAKVMHDYLVQNGVSASNIIVDSSGMNTYASAKFTAQVIQQRKINSVLIISQYFHLPRSRLALKYFGISNVYYAHANYFEIRDIYSLLREVAGCVTYSLRSYSPINNSIRNV